MLARTAPAHKTVMLLFTMSYKVILLLVIVDGDTGTLEGYISRFQGVLLKILITLCYTKKQK